MKEYIVGYNTYGGGFIQDADGVGYFLLSSEEEMEDFIAAAPASRGVEFWEAQSLDDLVEALIRGRRRFQTARLIA